MRYYKHVALEGQEQVTVYPFVCMHVGVPESRTDFIQEHVQRILDDPTGVAIYMGDAGDCSLIHSKGDVYEQTLSPGAQLDYAAELLSPLGSRLLFGINGNHGRRVTKLTGVDWDHELCVRLGIPYLGTSTFMRLDFPRYQKHTVKYDLYFHHGAGGSITNSGKVTAAEKFNKQVVADAVFTAHTHACMEIPPDCIAYLPSKAPKILYRYTHKYVCGCAYDSRSGYAEEKGYPPIIPAYIGVTFYAPGRGKGQSATIYRATV